MQPENTDFLNWRLWCRLCARADSTTNISIFLKDEQETKQIGASCEESNMEVSGEKINLIAAIKRYFAISIKTNEDQPKMLCLECFNLTTSLIKFSERITKVQQMFYAIKKSSEKCENLDLNDMRIKFKLLNSNDEHALLKNSLPKLYYIESHTKRKETPESIHNEDINSIDPLEFSEAKFKIENEDENEKETIEEYLYSDDSIGDAVENSSMSCNELLEESSSSEIDLSVASVNKTELKKTYSKAKKHDNMHKKSKKFVLIGTDNRSVQDNADFSCTECARKYRRERDYYYHLKHTHNIFRTEFPCTQCSRVYASKSRLTQHTKLHLPIELRKTFACHICEEKFTSNFSLKSHIKIVHMKLCNSYVCEECGTVTQSQGALRSHQLTHSDKRPYSCEICGKAFKSNKALKRHKELHKGKVICPECGLQLSSKSTLRYHLLMHSDEMKHKCEQCGRSFKSGKTLKNHLITHTGLRPYTCEFCNQTFSFGSTWRMHKRKQHPEELAELEASGAPKPYTKNIPKIEVLKAMTKPFGNVHMVTIEQSKNMQECLR